MDRITRQLQRTGLVAAGVAPALAPVFDHDGQVVSFVVPADVRELVTAQKGMPHQWSGQKKNAIKGPDDFLTLFPAASTETPCVTFSAS